MLKTIKNFSVLILLGLMLFSLTAFSPAQGDSSGEGKVIPRITQVDTSQFPKVTVYVSVTGENGEPVPVSVSDLVLRENGEVMKPLDVSGSGEYGPLTTLLVMDVSGSMNYAGKLDASKRAAKAYIDQNRPQDFIGILAFNTGFDYVRPLTSNREKLYTAVDELKAEKDTAFYDALVKSIDLLEASQGRIAIIALTDGMDNRSKTSSQEVIQLIGPSGLSISTIGLGEPSHRTSSLSGINEPALRAFSEQAGGLYSFANDAESLKALYELYGRALQSEYAITYESPSQLRDGVNRALTVTLEGSSSQAALAGSTGSTQQGGSAEGDEKLYNPGGLVPEVAEPASWSTFTIILVLLLILLLIPTIIFFVVRLIRGDDKGKVKIKSSGSSSASSSAASKSTQARVKLK